MQDHSDTTYQSETRHFNKIHPRLRRVKPSSQTLVSERVTLRSATILTLLSLAASFEMLALTLLPGSKCYQGELCQELVAVTSLS